LVTALSLGGCATKNFVRDSVGVVNTRVNGVEGHLAQVDSTAKEALDRANAAQKTAEGKFVYQVVLSDDSVKFPAGKSTLSPEAQTRLTELAQRLKSENRNVYLEIQGHIDPRERNAALGQARADTVRRFLNQQGVALNRMSTISYGKDSPVAPSNTADGRAQNRRVVIVVLG
jgi:outer membrane protein OmpA-like peptidoglycan-associated protein